MWYEAYMILQVNFISIKKNEKKGCFSIIF